MSDELVIRRAAVADAGAIGRIYDEAAATGTATFATGPHSAEERRAWLAARGERAPVWCAEVGGAVVGWSALAPFSHRTWYAGRRGVHRLRRQKRSTGAAIGGAMLRALIAEAPAFGYWKLVGMILPENAAGLALARGAGFREVGTHRAHARRDGEWRDVTILERHVEAPS